MGLLLYDVTTLYFEAEYEDGLRRVGMSKERRVDPQILVGLLVDQGGFPLEVHEFEGNKGETLTLLPVLDAFRERHQATEVVVVADAGMLSAANLGRLEDAGLSFIVGSRTTLNKQIERAEQIAAGTRPAKKDRFVTLGEKPTVNQARIDKAREYIGLKGYVTNLTITKVPAAGVVAAYHDLFQVEASFRMAKTGKTRKSGA